MITDAQIENAKWSQSQLSEELLAFHRRFPPTVEIDLGQGRTLLAFHATPRSRVEVVGPWMEEDADEVIRSVEESGLPIPDDAAGPWRQRGTPT